MESPKKQGYDNESDRLSLVSCNSIVSSTSNVVMMNPDGTLMSGVRASLYAKKKEEEKLIPVQPPQQTLYVLDGEEVIFYGDTNEIPIYFDEFVKLYLKHKKIFAIALIAIMLADIGFGILGYLNRDITALELKSIYPRTSLELLKGILEWVLTIDAAFSVIYYLLGIVALCTKSSKLLSYFTTLSLAGLFFQMLLAYVNEFNFLTFLMRFILLIYSRFLNQIMISLVLIPTATANPSQQYSTFAGN